MISIFVFQFMVPSVSAFPSTEHAHSQKADYRLSDCGMMMEKLTDVADGAEEHNGHHENAAHCMPSMCCFHDTYVSAKLVAIGLLLPISRWVERGTALSSHSGPSEDRPPRHV